MKLSVGCKLGLGKEFNIELSVISFDCCCRTMVDVVNGAIVLPTNGLLIIFANEAKGIIEIVWLN